MTEDNPVNLVNANNASQFALRVALQTMKERCMSQQKRLIAIEEENQKLRECIAQDNKTTNANDNTNSKSSSNNNNNNKVIAAHNGGGVVENFQLRVQVSELQRQNEQLTAHINMVSAENRKLWSRLSQMTKEKNNDPTQNTNDLILSGNGGDIGRITNSNQNLIRSKTFTQHSPNPKLRHKLIAADNTELELELAHVNDNLEEALNEVLDSAVPIEFSFLSSTDCPGTQLAKEHNADELDFQTEAKKCIEGLQEMRREAMKQHQKLNNVFTAVKTKLASNSCRECAKTVKKPEMADKSLETDESLNECIKVVGSQLKQYQQQYKQLENDQNTFDFVNKLDETMASTSKAIITSTMPSTNTATSTTTTNVPLNIMQEKLLADRSDKMCPMCGRIFDSRVSFNAFCEHVEEHFLDDSSDTEFSKEHNFEIISHAVGNF